MIDFTSPTPPEGIAEPLWGGDVGRLFKVDPKTVTRWAKTGRLKGFRTPGGHRRYHWADVAALGRKSADAPVPLPDSAGASAVLTIGGSAIRYPLYLTPQAPGTAAAGTTAFILGVTTGGKLITVETTSLEWLDDAEAAIQEARARGVVQGGMTAAAVQ